MSKLLIIILLHILGDSLLLSKKLRKLKIDNIAFLFKHVGIYTALFLFLSPLLLSLSIAQALIYSLLNGVFHFIVDYLITLVKKKYWTSRQYEYIAFLSIMEQLIHVSILIGTFLYLFPNAVDYSNWGNVLKYYFFEKPV